jgi:hypothetical protein
MATVIRYALLALAATTGTGTATGTVTAVPCASAASKPTTVPASKPSGPDAFEVVYTKEVPGGRRLIVTKREVPVLPPQLTREQWEQMLGRPVPEKTYVPDHTYRFSFELEAAESGKRELLWTTHAWDCGELNFAGVEWRLRVLDAAVLPLTPQAPNGLVVVYSQDGSTRADVITPGRAGRGEGMRINDTELYKDSPARGNYVVSGKIEVDADSGNLVVTVGATADGSKDVKRTSRHFLVRYGATWRWLADPPATQPAVEGPADRTNDAPVVRPLGPPAPDRVGGKSG